MNDENGSPFDGIRQSLDGADKMSSGDVCVAPVFHVGLEERFLRDYFAAQAMVALAGSMDHPLDQAYLAELCYQVADAMLKERS